MKQTFWQNHEHGFYFRVFGYGLAVVDRSKHPPPFSVRNGYTRELRLGDYGVQFLKRQAH